MTRVEENLISRWSGKDQSQFKQRNFKEFDSLIEERTTEIINLNTSERIIRNGTPWRIEN